MKPILTCLFLLLIILFNSCKKEDFADSISIDSPDQFYAVIAGKEVTFFNDTSAQANFTTADTLHHTVIYETYITDFNYGSIKVSMGSLSFDTSLFSAPVNDFYSFIAPGSYIYSVAASEGIEITYTDTKGGRWSTGYGPATQAAKSFRIDEVKSWQSEFFHQQKIKAEFNCNLYLNGSDSMITLDNGAYIGSFGNF